MSVITPFPHPRDRRSLTAFDRLELRRILDLYGRMVAAGHWRDYAMHFGTDVASFAAFRRAADRPEIWIQKRPELQAKQGAFALVSDGTPEVVEVAPLRDASRSTLTVLVDAGPSGRFRIVVEPVARSKPGTASRRR